MEVSTVVFDAAGEGRCLQIVVGDPLLQCRFRVHAEKLYMVQPSRSSVCCRIASGEVAWPTTQWGMDSEPPFKRTFIREWRKFRKLTIDELAAKSGMDKGNLSKLERGLHPYKQDTLDSIAKALETSSEVLITRGPEEPTPFYVYLARANPTVRKQIEQAAAAIYKASEGE